MSYNDPGPSSCWMWMIGTPAERARSSSAAISSSASCTPSSSITPRVYVFWQSIRMRVDSDRLTGCWGRSARTRSVGLLTRPSVLCSPRGACDQCGHRESHRPVIGDELPEPRGCRPPKPLVLIVIDGFGQRPTSDLGVQTVLQ